MKLKTTKTDLLKVLTTAIKAVPAKTTLPILENFLFKVNEDTLTVISSDQAVTVIMKCPASGDGDACVPAKTIFELVKVLPDTEVVMTSDEKSMKVDWGKGHSEIPVFPVSDYPEIGNIPSGEPQIVKCVDFKSAIAGCLPCIGEDEMRPVLSGIFFNGETGNGKLEMASTDAHCLAIVPIDAEWKESFILHKTAAAVIKDNIGDGITEIRTSDKTIYVTNGDFTLSVRKVEGNFPKYRTIIPANNTNVLELDTVAFISAIKRVSTCANKASNVIKFTLSTLGGCIAEAQDLGFNLSAREVIDHCSYSGEDLTIGMKASLLLQLIGAYKSASLRMKFSDSRKAVLIESDEEDMKAIIMPVATA